MLPDAIRKAARIVTNDGVIAYPTEGVFGLGCRPDSMSAVGRILAMKRRKPTMGLVLIAANVEQLAGWSSVPLAAEMLRSSADRPVTYVVPASASVPWWIHGDHTGVAVRLAAHPVAAALCRAAATPLVSTSANVSGRAPACNMYVLRRQFGRLVDYVVPGHCGPARGPSEIRVLNTGITLRDA